MTMPEPLRLPGEAVLRYLDGTFEVVERGEFVRCAITGKTIPLSALRYWSVDRQEPYADLDAATARIRQGETP